MENYHTLIKEVTTIEWDKSQLDRFGEEYPGKTDAWAIRASRYNQREQKENYGNQLDDLRERVYNELSILPDDQIRKCIKRLTLLSNEYIDKYFPEYFKFGSLWYSGEFKAMDFELKFFPWFKMQAIHVYYPDSQDFNDLVTTEDFFYDLQDALMYKHGIILHLIHDLSVFIGDKVEIFVLQYMKEKELHEKWFAKSESYRKSVTDSKNLPEPK